MSHAIHTEGLAGRSQPPRAQAVRSRESFAERRIESRLHQLADDIRDLGAAPYPALLLDRADIRKAIEELGAKHTTLLWVARVAKCTEGGVRERLWANIDRALISLEKVADSLARG
jgi:hypothetical protein